MPNNAKDRVKDLVAQILTVAKSAAFNAVTAVSATITTLASTDVTVTNLTFTKLTKAAVDLARSMTDINSMTICKSVDFTETAVAGAYTGAVVIPAGALVLDVQWLNTAVWTNNTAATMKCGDAGDDDGIFAAVDVKASPIASMALSYWRKDAGVGAYAGTKPLYYAAGGTITAVVTTTGATGTAGRSTLFVRYMLPQAQTAAVKA